MKICNAFSLQMVSLPVTIKASKIDVGQVKAFSLESAIGHADTANIVSALLGVNIPANRTNIKLSAGESIVVAQYIGPRLPEGATKLPDGARIDFVLVEVV